MIEISVMFGILIGILIGIYIGFKISIKKIMDIVDEIFFGLITSVRSSSERTKLRSEESEN